MPKNRPLGVALGLGLMLTSLAFPLPAQTPDWRLETAGRLYQKDYRVAAAYLQDCLPNLDQADKPMVTALLAFLSDKLGDKKQSRDRVLQFFETYGGPNLTFTFLDMVSEGDVTAFINAWRGRYPQVSNITLVRRKNNRGPLPPESVELGIDMANDAYYRFSDASGIMGGGILHRGFNILAVPAEKFFEHSGAHVFVLDLKLEDLVLRKEVTIAVTLTPEPSLEPEKKLAEGLGMEYKLSFYIGDRLVVTSTKLGQASNPLKLGVKPSNLVANPLFKPPGDTDPFDSRNLGFSIPQAIGLLAGLVKDLVTKKPQKLESSIEKLNALGITFFRSGAGGSEVEVKAWVSLQTRSLVAGR